MIYRYNNTHIYNIRYIQFQKLNKEHKNYVNVENIKYKTTPKKYIHTIINVIVFPSSHIHDQ